MQFLTRLVQQKLVVCLFFVLVMVGGLLAFNSLPIDAFPDLTNTQVQILTEAPGMAPIEAEQLVTIPTETVMNGLPQVKQIRSLSKFGLSAVTVVFDDNVNTYFARQLVNERLQSVRSRIPSGLTPELGPITTGMGEIYQYVVEGYGYSPTELRTLHDWDIKYRLRTVPGVNEVNTWGGYAQEYHVTLLPDQLIRYGLTLQQVFQALQANNANFSGGILTHGPEQYTIRGLGRIEKLWDIGQIVITKQGNVPITLNQVAQIGYGRGFRQGAVTKDGKGEVVTGLVMMLKGENSRTVIQQVKAKIRQIQHTLPEGVRISPFYDQTHLVEQTLHTVESNLVEGGMLVIAVLLAFLGNIWAALIVALTIPLSLMFSFMGMKALGITANIMSLGAIDFGMIVDGSIVMVEDILNKLAHQKEEQEEPSTNPLPIIQQSVQEMAKPIFFGVLIITVVYLPILSLEGLEAKLFSPMVYTVSFALLGSLLIALTLVPVLCSLVFRGKVKEWKNPLLAHIEGPYLRLLKASIHHKKATLGLALAAFVGAIALIPILGTEFVPSLDEGDMIIEVRNLPSIALDEATAVSTKIEKLLTPIPEVKTVVSKTGRPELATDPMSVYQTDVYVILKPKAHWRAGINKNQLTQTMRERLAQALPGSTFNFTQPIAMRVNELVSGVRADVAIKLFGPDMDVLTQKAEAIRQVMSSIPGQADLQVEHLTGSGQILIHPNRQKMALLGVSMDDIRTLLETAVIGTPVSEVIDGKKRFTLRAKLAGGEHTDPLLVSRIQLKSTSGQLIPLSAVATVEVGEGMEVVNREMGERRITIQMNVRDRDIGSFVKEGKAKLAKQVALPIGYYLDWGGQFENQQHAMQKLSLVVPVAIGIIFLLLMATFASWRHAVLVMMNVPFALIGGIVALYIRGLYLSVPAAIGFIALFGVAVLNGLVLVSTLNRLRSEGQPLHEAIVHGAKARLRPVLITALVAILGFTPMAFSTGSGAEIQKPLATVVIGGLFSATLLTLLVLPTLYSWIEAKNDRSGSL